MKKINGIEKNSYKKSLLELACLAAYKPLNKYNWANKITKVKEISCLVKQQIEDPKKEKEIQNTISLLKLKILFH